MPEWGYLKDGPANAIPERSPASKPGYAPELPAAAGDRCRTRSRACVRSGVRETGTSANVHPHKKAGYAAVTLSLRRPVSRWRRHRRADGKNRRPRRPPFFRRAARVHEQNLICRRAAGRSATRCGKRSGRWGSPPQCRPVTHIICWPGRGLLLARQRQVDPGGRAIQQRSTTSTICTTSSEIDLNISDA